MPHSKRDWAKLDELLLYVAERCMSDPAFGKVKLNKILFYADFFAYVRLGASITSEDYVKQPFGPVPCHLEKRIAALEGKDLQLVKQKFHNQSQSRIVPKRQANLSLFTGPEIALVEEVIGRFLHFTGSDLSDLSYEFLGWQAAKVGEAIPYSVALLNRGASSTEKIDVARSLASRVRKLKSS